MRVSVIVSAFVAALVGFGGTLALILAAAAAVGASPAEASSWVAAICLAIAATSAFLSMRYRMPIIAAWSTPGAALIAGFGSGIGMASATGAFLVAGLLMVLCAAIKPLGALVARIPVAVAAAMLAGVLVRFVMALAEHAAASPALVLPVIAVFFIVRRLSPNWAVPAALVAGGAAAILLGRVGPMPAPELSALVWTTPRFDPSVLVGLGVPLFLVTMASQNLPGVAVIRATGYNLPISRIISMTGIATLVLAPFGGYALNLSAITAAICMGPEAHEDKSRRYTAAAVCGLFYIVIGIFGAVVTGLLTAFPRELVVCIAGLALLGSIGSGLATALQGEEHREAALITFLVTLSGVVIAGVGSAFWGVVAGSLALFVQHYRRARAS